MSITSRFKKIWMVAIVAISLGLTIGCGQEEDEEYVPTPAITPSPAAAATPANQAPGVLPAQPADAALPQSLPATNLPPVQTIQPSAAGARPTINPAHGQPFHECSIAVGAPLPSAGASSPVVAPVQTMPQTLPSAPVLPNFPSGAKLNPPHGKPGHRCEIAVGAPLS